MTARKPIMTSNAIGIRYGNSESTQTQNLPITKMDLKAFIRSELK